MIPAFNRAKRNERQKKYESDEWRRWRRQCLASARKVEKEPKHDQREVRKAKGHWRDCVGIWHFKIFKIDKWSNGGADGAEMGEDMAHSTWRAEQLYR